MTAILEVRDLGKTFGSITAARDLDIAIAPRETVGIIGANGAGKTTFVNLITGYLEPSSGRILFENRDITDDATLRAIWSECELAEVDFERRELPELLQQVLREHNEAQEHGATGVPAVRVEGGAGIIVGAQPYALYERWVRRLTTPAQD